MLMDKDLLFDGKRYISSGRAAKLVGYAPDYVGQLCRMNLLDCRMVGRSWYVNYDSILGHKKQNSRKPKRKKEPKKIVEVSREAKPLQALLYEKDFGPRLPILSKPSLGAEVLRESSFRGLLPVVVSVMMILSVGLYWIGFVSPTISMRIGVQV